MQQSVEKKTVYTTQYSDTHISRSAVESNQVLKNITFVSNSSLMANLISAITADGEVNETDSMENGTWLWTPISQITTAYAETIILGAQKNGIKNIYISIDPYLDIYAMPYGEAQARKKKEFSNSLEVFIAMAQQKNISYDASD